MEFKRLFNWKRMSFLAILALGLGLLLPNFLKATSRKPLQFTNADSQLNEIKANLKMIEAAKEEWATVNKKAMSDSLHMADLTQYFPNQIGITSITGEFYTLTTVADFAEAILQEGTTLNGKTGPFTITSFD